MGTFAGHALPGSFFILHSLWLALNVLIRHFRQQSKRLEIKKCGLSENETVCKASHKIYGRFPLEGYVKVIATSVGFAGEWYTAYQGGHFVHMMNAQHMTMFFFFGLNGLVDIATNYSPGIIPKDLDYFTLALAFFVEGLLFYFHLHGRNTLDVHVHQLLLIAILMSLIGTLLEWQHKNDVRSGLFRAFAVALQGTWFWQVGFILYDPFGGPEPDYNSHKYVMWVTSCFCIHILCVLLVFFGLSTCFNLKQANSRPLSYELTDEFDGLESEGLTSRMSSD